MARECEICGKKTQVGHTVETRGKAKYLGGVGTKITGQTKRKFFPNLQSVKVQTDEGPKRQKVCVQCIRSGAIRKAVKQKPFALPAGK
jgi:large subunit ribosomal protein L28